MSGSRESLPLDGAWSFHPDPGATLTVASLGSGQPILVPGCWEAQIDHPYGIRTAWYRREFDIPAAWAGDRIVIRFGAVMYACEVHLNGRLIGTHEGGYTPFELDAGAPAIPGATNVVAVRITNPLNEIREYPVFPEADLEGIGSADASMPIAEIPHGKQTWYSSQSGIWQSVRIERRSAVALAGLRIRPDVGRSLAIVSWRLDPLGAAEAPHGATLVVEIVGPDGTPAGRAEVILAPGERDGTLEIALQDVRLWDIDQPHLYGARARLVSEAGEPIDEVTARFGMREIRTENGRILLNGRAIYLLAALDQDLYPDTISTPPSRAFLDEQMRLSREMGLNLLRCHIKVPDPAYLDAADEAGILVWCELPNWLRFSRHAGARGRATLEAMVEELGNHPSLVIWTIINEDWGTRLREEARDRRWVAETYDWLKALDPDRLIVDNSACETSSSPNFHLVSDLADFHLYFVGPDHAGRWRERVAEFATSPPWLWSPHGDARRRGDEPLVLSEFGGWGLPRPERIATANGGDPWWFGTGRGHFRPAGWHERFRGLGLDRVWPSLGDLAEATQWHQFEALQDEIGALRRQDAIQGYVVTELCDANWEANGLLDERRGRKAYHDRLAEINAPDVVVAELERRDLRGGERLTADVTVSSYGPVADDGLVEAHLAIDGRPGERVSMAAGVWPQGGARSIGRLELNVPEVDRASDAQLTLTLIDGSRRERARSSWRLAVIPDRPDAPALDVAVDDPSELWNVAGRVQDVGHRLADHGSAAVTVMTELDSQTLRRVEDGERVLLLVRSRDAIPAGLPLARPVAIHPRRLPHPDFPGDRGPWEGDWVTTWAWLRHDLLPGLPERNPLDYAYREVLPDHVLTGYEPTAHGDEVVAGMFAGWINAPAAIAWTFGQGRGAVTITTFRVAPEHGPLASLLLDRLIRHAASASAPAAERTASEGLA